MPFASQGAPLFAFRRGSLPRAIHSLGFSPVVEGSDGAAGGRAPTMLCAASSTTVHVWQLGRQRCPAPAEREGGRADATGPDAGWATWMRASAERDFAHVHLKPAGPECRVVAAIGVSLTGRLMLYVVSLPFGVWCSYRLDALRGGELELQDERRLVHFGAGSQ